MNSNTGNYKCTSFINTTSVIINNIFENKLINSKKVRKQIIELKQDVSKPDFGREKV